MTQCLSSKKNKTISKIIVMGEKMYAINLPPVDLDYLKYHKKINEKNATNDNVHFS